MAKTIIHNHWELGVTIYHSTDENVSYSQLEAEGRAYAQEHYPGRNCTIAIHGDLIEGDHVHVVVKE